MYWPASNISPDKQSVSPDTPVLLPELAKSYGIDPTCGNPTGYSTDFFPLSYAGSNTYRPIVRRCKSAQIRLSLSDLAIQLSCDNCIRAVVNLVINNEFALMDIILMNKDDHYFIGMPSKKVNNDFYEYFHPINFKTRNQLEYLITSLYSNMTNNQLRTINMNKSLFFDDHLELAYQEKKII